MEQLETQRPTPVTLIGWVWMTLSILALAKAAVSLLLWRAIRPAYPLLASIAGERSAQSDRAAVILRHLTAITVVQAILAATVLIVAWQFLRLRAWARVALRVASVLCLFYIVALAALWTATWTGALPGSTRPPSIHWRPGLELAIGLALCLAFFAGFVTMILALGSPTVRNAFRSAGPGGSAEGRV